MTRRNGLVRRRWGGLSAVALVLLGAAFLRLPGDGRAEAEVAAERTKENADREADLAVRDAAADGRAVCPRPAETTALLAAIRDRQAQLDERSVLLERRLRDVRQAEKRLAAEREALLEAERKLAATLAQADKAAERDLARLTAVYENMKPRVAAELFAKMAPEFAAGFMGRMRPEAAAAIMSAIPPARAYAISVILAGRNANVPRN